MYNKYNNYKTYINQMKYFLNKFWVSVSDDNLDKYLLIKFNMWILTPYEIFDLDTFLNWMYKYPVKIFTKIWISNPISRIIYYRDW